ncbi:MAG: phosphoenolpyruvate--protein phosphotransferase [Chloroflexi bacterium]|nr:phosphoenolpyruvate--protein phosphotransferase [Chloroflexota bacterium]
MKRLRGLAAAPGVARAGWVRIDPAPAPMGGRTSAAGVVGEVRRLAEASASAAVDLEAISNDVRKEGHPDEAAIFEAQAAIARDPALAAMATERIRDAHDDAIAAVLEAAGAFADQLRSLEDELLAARAADVIDVGDRIARRIAGIDQPTVGLERAAVVVADDLPPSVTATLPRERLLGIALAGSSPTAHAAILARAYGIPAVVAVRDLLETLTAAAESGNQSELAIDGATGDVFVDPDEATIKRLNQAATSGRERHEQDLVEARFPAVTHDGTAVSLVANIGTPDESDGAIALGAEGVGLFRTEFLFLERTSPPSEDEQCAAYERAIRAFAPHPVTIRLLDVGGDKPIPYLPIASEANPFLGVRALRLARTAPDLFVTQLRACYRAAAAGPVKVMAPMVADLGDVELLLTLAERARTELTEEGCPIGDVALGVMLEIPSAILVSDTYFGRIAFASLGTNDLAQYTLAVDRGNPALEQYRDALHPAVLCLIAQAVDAATRSGIELSVCGEMAGDPAAALALVGLGLRSLSMAAPSLPAVRRAIRGSAAAELASAARAALDEASATAARARFDALLPAGGRA